VSVADELSGTHPSACAPLRLHRPTRAVLGVALHNIDLLCRGLFASQPCLPPQAQRDVRPTCPGDGGDELMRGKTWFSIKLLSRRDTNCSGVNASSGPSGIRRPWLGVSPL
jgi:hypothetical protein